MQMAIAKVGDQARMRNAINPLIAKMAHSVVLTHADEGLLEQVAARTRRVRAGQDIVVEGVKPDFVRVLTEGYACRYRVLKDGERAILSILLPGDFFDLHVQVLGYMDHSVTAISDCEVAEIPQEAMKSLQDRSPRIMKALWWATLVDDAIWREWLLNMGRRPAEQQMAHLFCEVLARLQACGQVVGNEFPFPLTQEQMGDVLGISTVHVNRVLQGLIKQGLVIRQGRRITLPDPAEVAQFCGFDAVYLHLGPAGFWNEQEAM